MSRPEAYIEEDLHQMEGLPREGAFFHHCAYCYEPIEFDEVDATESEYVETDAGYMHTDCALEYFKDYIRENKKIAYWNKG